MSREKPVNQPKPIKDLLGKREDKQRGALLEYNTGFIHRLSQDTDKRFKEIENQFVNQIILLRRALNDSISGNLKMTNDPSIGGEVVDWCWYEEEMNKFVRTADGSGELLGNFVVGKPLDVETVERIRMAGGGNGAGN